MAVTINGDGLVDVGGTSTSQGRVRLAEDTDNGANYIELTAPASVASNKTITFPDATGTVLTTSTAVFQQYYLSKSGSNLLLSPRNGNLITINSAAETIPDAGVTLAATGLSNTTKYYVYAYMSSGTMTLEASTTGYATQNGTGNQIKSGDATRTLVGMCYLQSGAFVSSSQKQLVRSWANSGAIQVSSGGSVSGSTTSNTLVEINTAYRAEFLKWSHESVSASYVGYCNCSIANYVLTQMLFDGAGTGSRTQAGYNGVYGGFANLINPRTSDSEGYHYVSGGLYDVSGIGTSAVWETMTNVYITGGF